MSRIIALYSTIVTCPNTDKECPNTINDPATGNLPRGFYTAAKDPKDVLILLVAKNPGAPCKEEIDGLYRGQAATEQVLRQFELQRQLLNPPAERFGKNLCRYMSYFLDTPPEEIFRKCAYTNLVKCTSPGIQDKLQKKAIDECFQKHLYRELALFSNVKLIIAFGREVQHPLTKPKTRETHGKPVIYIKHPSYYYRKEEEAEILAKLKKEITLHLGGKDC